MKLITLSLVLLFSFTACHTDRSIKGLVFKTGPSKEDSAIEITTSYSGKAYPQIFEAAFYRGTKSKEQDASYDFYIYNMGSIKIESGKVIACDPIVMKDAGPFTQICPTGNFPVELALAKTKDDERVAFSRISFNYKDVVKWKLALHAGQEPLALADTNFYCYGVDGGIGMFIDSVTNEAFKRTKVNTWEDMFMAVGKNDRQGYIYNLNDHNTALFRTGYGDGCYATYIGLDSAGNVCRLLTDFGLVSWWKQPEKK